MNNETVQPWQVAAKLAAVAFRKSSPLTEQFEKLPRLAEALWFIEWRSRQSGGLEGLAKDLVAHAGETILPAEFRKIPVDKQRRFSADDAFQVWARLPNWARPGAPEGLKDAIAFMESAGVTTESSAMEAGFSQRDLAAFREWLTRDACAARITTAAVSKVVDAISRFFSCDDQPFPACIGRDFNWKTRRGPDTYRVFSDLPQLIFSYMNHHAQRQLATVADTGVTAAVFEAMEYAVETKSVVIVLGRERFGKTESMKAWADAYPGRMRLVRTPSVGAEKMFLLRIAEALGFSLGWDAPLAKVREQVCFVLQHGGLTLAFDESNFLLPASYGKTTAPARLNFVRTELVDRGLGCILTATPQAHRDSIVNFVNKTRYAMGQWLGRVDKIYALPEGFGWEEMVRVAKVRLPGLSQKAAEQIAASSKQTAQFLPAISSIGKRALWLARKDGREQPTPDDIKCAANEYINGVDAEINSLLPEYQAQPAGSRKKPNRARDHDASPSASPRWEQSENGTAFQDSTQRISL